MKNENLVRLHKFIADCGVASRRNAEKMIAYGEVTVNGEVIKEMGYKIMPGKDAVKVRGKLLRVATQAMYVALYKPAGVVTTLNDPEGRKTVKDLLYPIKERLFPVGPLDYDSEGLIIMTNDGEYAQAILHPKDGIRKVYQVKIKGKPEQHHIDRLRQGVTLPTGKARASYVERMKVGDQYDWFKVVLTDGNHHRIRRMFEKIGFDVMKIKRVAIGRLTLGKLERGQYRVLTKEQAELAFKD